MQAVFYETDSTSKTTVTEPSTDPLGPTPAAVTPAELPKSAVVATQEDGTAAIEEKQAPGYLASAAGSPNLLLARQGRPSNTLFHFCGLWLSTRVPLCWAHFVNCGPSSSF